MSSGVSSFWVFDIKNLFKSLALLPLSTMDIGERLNALTRLIILGAFIIKLIYYSTNEWLKFLLAGFIVIFLLWVSALIYTPS